MFPTPAAAAAAAHEAAARADQRFANKTGFKPFINSRSFSRRASRVAENRRRSRRNTDSGLIRLVAANESERVPALTC